jgi:Transposase DDE domain group 1
MTLNCAWLTASLTAATLLAWLQLPAPGGDLAKAEPKTLRYRILHTAARLTRGQRRRHLAIPATWPWPTAITTARTRIHALPHAP